MNCRERHMLAVLLLLLVPISLISCSGNSGTSLSPGNGNVATASKPGIPTELAAVGTDSLVKVSWSPPAGATSYNLYWNMTGGVTKDSNKILNVYLPFDHRDLTNGKTYYYRVSAVNISGESDLSAQAQATPMALFTKILTKLTDPDAEENEQFGQSVSIDGAYAVVGAAESSRLEVDNYLPRTGAAYVFYKKNGVWDPNGTKLMAFDGQTDDRFGAAVSISGDYIIVGAWGEDGGPGDSFVDAGAAYIFHRIGENAWDGGVKIAALYPIPGGLFGGAVSISGDYAVVGMTGGMSENSVYVFHRTGANAWESSDEIFMPESQRGDRFGFAVAISGDNMIIGAPFEADWIDNISLPDAGAAYLFRRTGLNAWTMVSKIMPHDITAGARFGNAVAMSGDYAAVAAFAQVNRRGSVYVFHRLAENFWDEGPKLSAPDAQEGDEFGRSVAITEHYVLVGAPSEDCGWDENMNEGSAYLFQRIGSNTWDSGTKITIPEGDIADNFGYTVAISGEHAVISAVGDDAEGNEVSRAGAAYLY